MASFKAKFPVLQELFAKNHRGGGHGRPAERGLKWVPTLFIYILVPTATTTVYTPVILL